ncbi:MAG: alpha-amylase family glycosyl hydrolase [Gemmatimonadales bacterium]
MTNVARRGAMVLALGLASGCAREAPVARPDATPTLAVPAWSADVIWYQIFVERFRNGDSTNDPTAHDIAGYSPDRNFGPDPRRDEATIAAESPADPSTWKWTAADSLFLALVREVHRRGMHIIIDYSWNHTGTSFWAWKDLLANQRRSRFAEWYEVERFTVDCKLVPTLPDGTDGAGRAGESAADPHREVASGGPAGRRAGIPRQLLRAVAACHPMIDRYLKG